MILLLIGDDELAIQRAVDDLARKVGDDPGLADLNITRLDGRQAGEDEIHAAAYALPFLTAQRLVVISQANPRLKGDEAARTRWQKLLGGLPETTVLVMVLPDAMVSRRGKREWDTFSAGHWLRKWLTESGKGKVKEFPLPGARDMSDWILGEAKRQGGVFTKPAADALAGHTASDTRQATHEITKLLTYVNFERPVQPADVDRLVAVTAPANIFAMVDALASRDGHNALRLLHQLLEEEEPQGLFGMIVRQFRLLIQAREMLGENADSEIIAGELHIPPYAAEKLARQARGFRMEQLEAVYHRLLELDEMMKSSQIDPVTALDLLAVELAA